MVNRIIASVFAIACVSTSRAEVILAFSWGQSSVDVLPGATAVVPLYLTETVTGGSSSLLARESGLSSVGVKVTRQSSSLPTRPAILKHNGIALNTVDFFDMSDPVFSPMLWVSPAGDTAQLLAFARDSGVIGTLESTNVRRILIGTMAFTAGNVGGETTRFSTGDYNLNSFDTVTWQNFEVLDSRIASSTLSINTVIPSPASALVFAMVGMGSLRRRR